MVIKGLLKKVRLLLTDMRLRVYNVLNLRLAVQSRFIDVYACAPVKGKNEILYL